jgi:hypothetical protein
VREGRREGGKGEGGRLGEGRSGAESQGVKHREGEEEPEGRTEWR